MEPTDFVPVAVTTLQGFCTVVTPVSSRLNILSGVNSYLLMAVARLLKYSFTLCWLKAEARPAEVGSGFLTDKWCLSLKFFHHYFPAFLFCSKDFGTGKLFLVANVKASSLHLSTDKP